MNTHPLLPNFFNTTRIFYVTIFSELHKRKVESEERGNYTIIVL